MSPLWSYFWPIVLLGLLLGGIPGVIWLPRMRVVPLAAAAAIALAGTVLWHGPLGAADRFAAKVEPRARAVLVDWEMVQVQARLHRSPLSRRLILSGPADDFQRDQLVKIMSQVPGVSRASWSPSGGLPLIAEALFAAMAGFLAGLLLAYGIELRRRYNAQWKW
jgi:hypothetical protein